MNTVLLGRTGVRVSPLAFGTMSFGGWADEETSAALYARCRDVGINHFDCADVYNEGRSEEMLGRFVREHRDQVVIATKAYFPTGDGPNDRGSSRFHLVRAVESSLRRLATDRIDIFYLHRWDDNTDVRESLRALDDLVRQGKILYPALSNVAAWQAAVAVGLCEANGWARPVCIQPMYNLAKRQAEVEILPMALSEGLGVIPYSPLGGGLLSGKYGEAVRPTAGRLIESDMYSTRYGAPVNYEIAERLSSVAGKLGVHPAALAIAWVASHPAVTAPLLGARSVEQLDACLGALKIEISPEQRREIDALSPAPAPATDRNEEASAANYAAALRPR